MKSGRTHVNGWRRRLPTRRPSGAGRRAGFTLIEAIVVIVILGVLAAVIAPQFINRVGQSKQKTGEANAASLATAVKLYMADHGKPSQGATIDILWERGDVSEEAWSPYVDNADALLDPWGNKFVLVIPGQKNIDFDIVSYGADGKPGGTGEDADIVKP